MKKKHEARNMASFTMFQSIDRYIFFINQAF